MLKLEGYWVVEVWFGAESKQVSFYDVAAAQHYATIWSDFSAVARQMTDQETIEYRERYRIDHSNRLIATHARIMAAAA